MKKYRTPALLLAAFTLLAFSSCDMIQNFIASRTRNIAVVQTYNSNHVKTNKLQPNDTLYVEVQGLKPNGFYQIDCLDPDNNIITSLTAEADADGVIGPSPLWYDVGFKKEEINGVWRAILPADSELGLNAFNIQVQSLDDAKAIGMTNFKLPFFVVFNTQISRPQPIVMAGRMVDDEFVLENAFEAGEQVYVKVANLNDLPIPNPPSGKAKIYILPFTGNHIEDGATIAQPVLEQYATIEELQNGVRINVGDNYNNASWNPIPAWAKGKAFSVIVDVNDNGIYEIKQEGTTDYYLDGIDGNGVAGFIVKQDPLLPTPDADYIPANIASGGSMGWVSHSFGWWPDYDYRNEFHKDGYDTKYAWDWNSGSSGYGIKAIWNPYVNIGFPQEPNSQSILYYGRYVDVWIVKTTELDLTGVNPLVAAPGTRKLTLPVQSSCDNGVYQQNIWPAPMIPGDYCVVVDLDGDGKVSDGDIVDNVATDDSLRALGGFSVID